MVGVLDGVKVMVGVSVGVPVSVGDRASDGVKVGLWNGVGEAMSYAV